MKLNAKLILMLVVYALALYGLIQLIRGLMSEQYVSVYVEEKGITTKDACISRGFIWNNTTNKCWSLYD